MRSSISLPSPTPRSWVLKEWPSEVLLAMAAIGAAVLGVWKFIHDKPNDRWQVWVLAGLACTLFAGNVLKLIKARYKDKRADDHQHPRDLLGCLYVIDAALRAAANISSDGDDRDKLRIVLHRVVGDELEQCTEYVGGEGGRPCRRFSIRSGILGHAVLTKEVVKAARKDDDPAAFQREMAERWHILPKEVSELRVDRQAWVAIPIIDEGDVVAVLWMDANARDFFADALVELAVRGCRGLHSFMRQRYGGGRS